MFQKGPEALAVIFFIPVPNSSHLQTLLFLILHFSLSQAHETFYTVFKLHSVNQPLSLCRDQATQVPPNMQRNGRGFNLELVLPI